MLVNVRRFDPPPPKKGINLEYYYMNKFDILSLNEH